MATRKIRIDGDSILRKICKPVKEMTPRLSQLIDDMFDTMYEANGVGLAAPQVGIVKRIVVIDIGDKNPLTLINPEIIETSGEQPAAKGGARRCRRKPDPGNFDRDQHRRGREQVRCFCRKPVAPAGYGSRTAAYPPARPDGHPAGSCNPG